MFRVILLSIFVFIFVSRISAHEGMWPVNTIKDSVISILKQKGLLLNADDIYSVNQSSLKDAVVIFGRGCTGEFVSDKGLLLTNHHCGYGSIQSVSSVEKDYLTHGFWAKTNEEEIPIPGLEIRILEVMEDVTSSMVQGISSEMTQTQFISKLKLNIDEFLKGIKSDGYTEVSVFPFFSSNQFYLIKYKVFKDVRLAGTPPNAIGKFGGDTDNWMWPRHTGDFSMFRVYADTANNPNIYSLSNKPYQPKKFLEIYAGGVKKGDFTMVLGFPGSTTEYLPASSIDVIRNIENPHRIQLRDMRLSIMDKYMQGNDTIRIKYASKHAGVANSWKKWIGENRGLDKLNAISVKKEYEKGFSAWASSKNEFAGLLPMFDKINSNNKEYVLVSTYFQEAVMAIEILRFVSSFKDMASWKDLPESQWKAKTDELLLKAKGFFKNYDSRVDKEIMAAMMEMYQKNVPNLYRVDISKIVKYKGDDYSLFADEIFKATLFSDYNKLETILKEPNVKNLTKLSQDPVLELLNRFSKIYVIQTVPFLRKYYSQGDSLQRIYMAAQMQYQPERLFYPDANFTMRVSFGMVDDYMPRDGVVYDYRTHLGGIIEKEALGAEDYVVPERLRQLYNNKDFGKWAENDTLYTCFTASNHTTGGNSGSPVLNAQGRLIGINFDRNWEGTMSDIMYDPNQCRNITLDVRYLLFVIEKYAQSPHLLQEMKIITE